MEIILELKLKSNFPFQHYQRKVLEQIRIV